MHLQINTLVDELSELPERDSASMRLLALVNDPDSDPRDVASVIEADPSMTARVLTLANSAFFAVRTPATNAWAAVMVVGFNVVRALAAAGSIGLNRDGDLPRGFVDHSLMSAAGAAALARHNGHRASDAFSAAMLHDVGGGLLYLARRSQWEETAVDDGEVARSVLDAERRVHGASHDEIGALVLEALHFPASIIDAVRLHNRPVDEIDDDLTRIVVGGIALAEHAGTPSTSQPITDPVGTLALLGVDDAGVADLVTAMHDELAELEAILR